MAKQTKITKSARGEDCSLRLGQCSSNETVILAHIGRDRGMGYKSADYMAVYSCANCHDIIDGRVNTEKLRALEETLKKLFDKDLICLR